MFNGYRVRTTLLAALHEKLLKLNSSSIARITTGEMIHGVSHTDLCSLQGHVINLASNDLKRFDNALPHWPYLFVGPFEAIFVLAAVSLYLGFLPAFAGMSCTLVIIPIQVSNI